MSGTPPTPRPRPAGETAPMSATSSAAEGLPAAVKASPPAGLTTFAGGSPRILRRRQPAGASPCSSTNSKRETPFTATHRIAARSCPPPRSISWSGQAAAVLPAARKEPAGYRRNAAFCWSRETTPLRTGFARLPTWSLMPHWYRQQTLQPGTPAWRNLRPCWKLLLKSAAAEKSS